MDAQTNSSVGPWWLVLLQWPTLLTLIMFPILIIEQYAANACL